MNDLLQRLDELKAELAQVKEVNEALHHSNRELREQLHADPQQRIASALEGIEEALQGIRFRN